MISVWLCSYNFRFGIYADIDVLFYSDKKFAKRYIQIILIRKFCYSFAADKNNC